MKQKDKVSEGIESAIQNVLDTLQYLGESILLMDKLEYKTEVQILKLRRADMNAHLRDLLEIKRLINETGE
jgi:hypothetical protein